MPTPFSHKIANTYLQESLFSGVFFQSKNTQRTTLNIGSGVYVNIKYKWELELMSTGDQQDPLMEPTWFSDSVGSELITVRSQL